MVGAGELDPVTATVREAVVGRLLADIDALGAGVRSAGWTADVGGGRWLHPRTAAWTLLSSDHAPSLGIFYWDEEALPVYARGQELVRLLDDEIGVRHRVGVDPEWWAWPLDDPRWSGWTGLDGDWLTWHGGPARVSLNVRPAHRPGRVRAAPHLHLSIERLDTPPEGLPEDADRARRVSTEGSPLARWHLAGDPDIAEDVVELLRRDDDPAVVAAVDAGADLRRRQAASRDSRP